MTGNSIPSINKVASYPSTKSTMICDCRSTRSPLAGDIRSMAVGSPDSSRPVREARTPKIIKSIPIAIATLVNNL